MAGHNETGRIGEDEAVEYLVREGYVIRHRNWRFGRKEIDIVAEREGTLVIVEVKTRRSDDYGSPEEAVTDRKIRNIVSCTSAYVKKYAIDAPVRFDVITLTGHEGRFVLRHIMDAFLPPVW